MTLEEHLAQFGRVLEKSGHDSSWSTADCTYKGEPSILFTFVTCTQERAEEAMRILGAAGLLCETPLAREGPLPKTPANTIQCLTEGLRGLAR